MILKNKYITFAFIALFAISGTGLPLLVHLCNTMHEVSFETCGMCQTHKIPHGSVLSRTDDCCNTTQLSASITDQYLSSKTQEELQSYTLAALPFIAQVEEPKDIFSVEYSGVSPPQDSATPLFIINSSFLI